MLGAMADYVETLELAIAGHEKLQTEADALADKVRTLTEYGQAQRRKLSRLQGDMDELRRRLRK